MVSSTNIDERHRIKSKKHKQIFEEKLSRADKDKGLLIVNTGTGKGKSTAAFGMGVRVLGHGMKLGVVQFIKGALPTAERDFLGKHANCRFVTAGEGYTWNTQDRHRDMQAALSGWTEARRMIEQPEFHMVILDEINVILKHGYLEIDEVVSVFENRRIDLHIVATGRHAPERLIEIADLVSEIKSVKHPYQEQGIRAQKGVEF